jgi:glyoxylase-like metal-dependent hydrolase (beta-lactamase superfamily II)
LAAAEIQPEDVDLVLLTHVHSDHCGWTMGDNGEPLIQNADHVVPQRELEALSETRTPHLWHHVVDPLRSRGPLRTISGRVGLRSSAGTTVEAVPTPGHTPGHQSVVGARGNAGAWTSRLGRHADRDLRTDVMETAWRRRRRVDREDTSRVGEFPT